MSIQIGIDVGGTFTDAAALVDGRLTRAKSYSTKDVSSGVLAVLGKLCDLTGIEERAFLSRIDKFVLGNTIVTNAIDEQRLCRVGLLTTAGFRDTLRIGRSARGSARDPHQLRPRPELVDRQDIVEIHERVDVNGTILAAADPGEIRRHLAAQ